MRINRTTKQPTNIHLNKRCLNKMRKKEVFIGMIKLANMHPLFIRLFSPSFSCSIIVRCKLLDNIRLKLNANSNSNSDMSSKSIIT